MPIFYETLAYKPEGSSSAKLAIADEWTGDYSKPEEFRWIYIFMQHTAEREEYLIGLKYGTSQNGFIVFHDPRSLGHRKFDITDCVKVKETRPVKKPRAGRRYDWVWRMGSWRKEWK